MLMVLFVELAIAVLKAVRDEAAEFLYDAHLLCASYDDCSCVFCVEAQEALGAAAWRARACRCDGRDVAHVRGWSKGCEGHSAVVEAVALLGERAGRTQAEEASADEARRRAKNKGFVVRKLREMFEPRVAPDVPVVDVTLLTEDWFAGHIDPEQLVPEFKEDSSPMVSANERLAAAELHRWLRRDEWELHRESKRRVEQGGSVEGDRTAPGLAGEREWLGAQLREVERGFKAGEKSRAEAQRHAKALRARFNTRRFVEALGGDPDSPEFVAWRKKTPMSYAKLNEVLASKVKERFHALELETLAVPGLISESPKSRAPQFARPKMTSIASEA